VLVTLRSALQRVAVCFNVLQCFVENAEIGTFARNIEVCVAACCSVCVAVFSRGC